MRLKSGKQIFVPSNIPEAIRSSAEMTFYSDEEDQQSLHPRFSEDGKVKIKQKTKRSSHLQLPVIETRKEQPEIEQLFNEIEKDRDSG